MRSLMDIARDEEERGGHGRTRDPGKRSIRAVHVQDVKFIKSH